MNNEQFIAVARYANCPMLLVKSDGTFLAANSMFYREFDLGSEAIQGQSIASLLQEPDAELFEFLQSCSRTRDLFQGHFTSPHGLGQDYVFEGALVQPREGDSPALIILRVKTRKELRKSFLALNQKIEELTAEIRRRKRLEVERVHVLEAEKKARADAERASRAKDEFLATASHELRTPMTAIVGWLDLLISGEVEIAEYSEIFAILFRNAQLEVKLISDILDVSRVISGKLTLAIEPLSPANIVDAAIATIRSAAAARRIQIYVSADPSLGTVSGDPDRLQQVIWNLLSNAVKFSPKGGKVFVTVQCVDSQIHISVSDEGEGIDSEFLPYVFERFLQEDGSKTRVHGGLGLGLSIVRHIVELHGGTVTANSPGKGLGTKFTVKLPLLAVYNEAKALEKSHGSDPIQASEKGILAGLNIIVVDDEADARQMISRILRQQGAEVAVAASAEEAIEHLKKRRPDVLVSDIGMPKENGYELIRSVRLLERGFEKALPAAALTAFASQEDRQQAFHAGFQKHLAKPVQAKVLIRTVAELAGRALDEKSKSL